MRTPSLRPAALSLALLASSAAGLSAQDAPAECSAAPRTDTPPPRAAASRADSAAVELHAALLAMARGAGVESPRGTFFFRAGGGRPPVVSFLDSNVPAETQQQVRPLLESYVSRLAAAEAEVVLRLHQPALGHVPEPMDVDTDVAGYCPPQLANPTEVRQWITAAVEHITSAGVTGAAAVREVEVVLLLGREGTPVDIRVERWSGDETLDARLVDLVRRIRWRPATFGGYPIDSRVSMPITFGPGS